MVQRSGTKPQRAVLHRLDRWRRQAFHLHEPLLGHHRFDRGLRAVRQREAHDVVLDLFEETLRVEVRHHLLARFLARQPGVGLARLVVQRAVLVEDVDDGQVVAFAAFVVGEVVARRHLHGAGPELHLHAVVRDDRDQAVHERQAHVLSDHVLVALVVGMHGHRGVAEHRLRARRRHDHLARAIFERVLEVPEVAARLLLLDLVVADRGLELAIPVHHPVTAVDEALLPKLHERHAHRAREVLVHRERGAAPVAGTAERPELAEDRVAVVVLPIPDLFQEGVAAEVVPRLLLFFPDLLFHDGLGRDAGVVGAGHPQHVLAEHALPPDQHVLDDAVQRVAHVQDRGDVGRRDHHRVGFGLGALSGRERTVLVPVPVPALLRLHRVVAFAHFGHDVGDCNR